MLSVKTLQWMVYGFLAIIVAIVFQQVYTSMTEQGIASGGPYNNGAAYPRAIAITIGVLLVCQIFTDRFSTESEQEINSTIEGLRSAASCFSACPFCDLSSPAENAWLSLDYYASGVGDHADLWRSQHTKTFSGCVDYVIFLCLHI